MEISNLSMKTGRKKFGIGSLILVLVIGVAFIVAGLVLVQSSKIDKTWLRTQGAVSSVEVSTSSKNRPTYSPVYQYEVDGQTYFVRSNTGSSSQPTIGSTTEVAYNPANPGSAKVVSSSTTKMLFWLVSAVGVALLIAAPIMFLFSRRRTQTITNLTESGIKVQGVLVDIKTTSYNHNNYGNNYDNDFGTVNVASNSHEYKIIVAAPDRMGNVHHFTSDTIMGVGGLAMADFHSTPIPIDVFIDPANPENYYVDISDIPQLTRERITDILRNAMHKQGVGSGESPMQPPTAPPTAPPVAPPTQYPTSPGSVIPGLEMPGTWNSGSGPAA